MKRFCLWRKPFVRHHILQWTRVENLPIFLPQYPHNWGVKRLCWRTIILRCAFCSKFGTLTLSKKSLFFLRTPIFFLKKKTIFECFGKIYFLSRKSAKNRWKRTPHQNRGRVLNASGKQRVIKTIFERFFSQFLHILRKTKNLKGAKHKDHQD